jgi:hypothetical protein
VTTRSTSHGRDGVWTSTTTWCAWRSGSSFGSPTSAGNAVVKRSYCFGGSVRAPAFGCSSPGGGQEIGSFSFPVIRSPAITTRVTRFPRTSPRNVEYGRRAAGSAVGRSENALQTTTRRLAASHHHANVGGRPPPGRRTLVGSPPPAVGSRGSIAMQARRPRRHLTFR